MEIKLNNSNRYSQERAELKSMEPSTAGDADSGSFSGRSSALPLLTDGELQIKLMQTKEKYELRKQKAEREI